MTLAEYAIARHANVLMRDAKKRDLEPEEWWLLDVLTPTISRVEQEEAAQPRRYRQARPGRVADSIAGR